MVMSRWIIFRMRNVSDKMCRENRNTCFVFHNFFPSRKPCRLWDNAEKCGTARQAAGDNVIRRMRFACWITKATDTHSEFVILMIFHSNNGYANAPYCYFIVHCLYCLYYKLFLNQVKRNVLFVYCKRVDLKQILPKHLCLPTQLYGIKSQKAVISTFNTVTNSNLTELNFPVT